MRRADRLFQLVQLIRGRRLSTAAWLAARLEVSVRTVYRDVADLQRQGVPIEGEAGVGYRLGTGFDLPPLMFSEQEAVAIAAAVRLAQPWLDPEFARAAQEALGRILSVLPPAARAAAERPAILAPGRGLSPQEAEHLQALRGSVQSRWRVELDYADEQARASLRTVRPLACVYWGKTWTLAAWCEARQDFRSFRLDRIRTLRVLQQSRFSDEPGRTLADFMRAVGAPSGSGT
jgi:predicted DNA-binding transcriptional regulator YafY